VLATSYQNGLNGFQWGRGYGRTVLECNLGNMEEWNDKGIIWILLFQQLHELWIYYPRSNWY
jgi:hypothetical protein